MCQVDFFIHEIYQGGTERHFPIYEMGYDKDITNQKKGEQQHVQGFIRSIRRM